MRSDVGHTRSAEGGRDQARDPLRADVHCHAVCNLLVFVGVGIARVVTITLCCNREMHVTVAGEEGRLMRTTDVPTSDRHRRPAPGTIPRGPRCTPGIQPGAPCA